MSFRICFDGLTEVILAAILLLTLYLQHDTLTHITWWPILCITLMSHYEPMMSFTFTLLTQHKPFKLISIFVDLVMLLYCDLNSTYTPHSFELCWIYGHRRQAVLLFRQTKEKTEEMIIAPQRGKAETLLRSAEQLHRFTHHRPLAEVRRNKCSFLEQVFEVVSVERRQRSLSMSKVTTTFRGRDLLV